MKELMLLLANTMTEEMIIDLLEKEILEYKSTKDQKVFDKIKMSCMLLLSKESIDELGGVSATIEMMEKQKKAYDLINTSNQ